MLGEVNLINFRALGLTLRQTGRVWSGLGLVCQTRNMQGDGSTVGRCAPNIRKTTVFTSGYGSTKYGVRCLYDNDIS